MTFQITPNVRVSRSPDGTIVHLSHLQEPYTSDMLARPTTTQLAGAYATDVMDLYGAGAFTLRAQEPPDDHREPGIGTELRLEEEKHLRGSATVAYRQTHQGLPIWGATLQVHLTEDNPRVTSSASTLHLDPTFDTGVDDDPSVGFGPDDISETAFAKAVAVRRTKDGPQITRRRLVWYRYDPNDRVDPEARPPSEGAPKTEPGAATSFEGGALGPGVPTLPLGPVDDRIRPGVHYLCREILFTYSVPDHPGMHWRALVEVTTGSVLYLRALTASATGCVYLHDPITQANSSATCSSTNADLNALRSITTLDGLKPPMIGNQVLDGDLVTLSVSPSKALPYIFCYDVKTPDFGGTNAYHHSDFVFRMVEDMGFVLADYFDGTTFPVPVEHTGWNTVNAQAPGNAAGNGLGKFRYANACPGGEISIAADQRVVLHEFGHAILWDHVSDFHFGFAHSAGDALAAIIHDPDTQAPDRYATFPWITAMNSWVDRRHDRDPNGGWAWFGTNWNTQYGGEQVLSTTLFRLYEALGGARTTHLPSQQWASRFTSFLIIKSVGTLTAKTPDPAVYATALMDADLTELNFEGQVGGAVHKVVRWAFEKQGLYRPASTPKPWSGPGDSPDVDVYIDDGRAGEYQHLVNFWSSTDIWNRLAPDGGSTHETPVTNQPNYVYVRVRNRGTQTANDVTVRGFHCEPGTGLVWPDDWMPMTTASLAAGGPIPPGGTTVVGPFEWTPEFVGHECLLMLADATGDLANDSTVNGSVAHSRFVPFDNNIGQRNVAPVAGGGGLRALLEALRHRRFLVRNPFPWPVRIDIQASLPKFLLAKGWGITFENPGGTRFSLGGREARHAVFSLTAGDDFTPEEAAAADAALEVVVYTDDLVDGGMTYRIDPTLKRQPAETSDDRPDDRTEDGAHRCDEPGKALLECLDIPTKGFSCAHLKSVIVDLRFEDGC
jgi:hypothetical protein